MVAGRGIEPLHLGYEPNQSTVTVPRKKKTGHLQLAEKAGPDSNRYQGSTLALTLKLPALFGPMN